MEAMKYCYLVHVFEAQLKWNQIKMYLKEITEQDYNVENILFFTNFLFNHFCKHAEQILKTAFSNCIKNLTEGMK